MVNVSVIIPCYNQGEYLDEAVESVLSQTYQDFEIVIVDDGSDDANTRKLLKNYKKPNTRIIRTENAGLAAARNTGVHEAKGNIILPLDADDRIGKEYLEKGVRILDANPDIGIVYCQAAYFGEKDGIVELPEFSMERILQKNIIFCSAFFRKVQWKMVGGYNINMVYGLEDWDFWLSILQRGFKAYQIPKTLFYYRFKKASMLNSMSDDAKFVMIKNVIFNHYQLYKDCAEIYIVPKVAQLYTNTGAGFNQRQVVQKAIFGSEERIEFDLKDVQQIQGLRFDPINDYCVVHIENIIGIDIQKKIYPMEIIASNAIGTVGKDFLFASPDPQVWIQPLQPVIRKIQITLNFIAIGKSAFEYILNYQKNQLVHETYSVERIDRKEALIAEMNVQIDLLNKRLAGVESRYHEIVESTTWRLSYPLRQAIGWAKRLFQQRQSIIDYLLFIYYCYFKKDMIPPHKFNYVGYPDFNRIGKHYFDNIIRFCNVEPHLTILDIGSGIGRVAVHFMNFMNPPSRYEGFDIVRRGVTWCTHKITSKRPNFRFQHADIHNKEYNPKGALNAAAYIFPYPDDTFDVAFASSLFTHLLPDPAGNYLKEIHRVLKPGGRIFISCFLLNEESKSLMGSSAFPFKVMNDHYGVMIEENPEAAIAYDERYFLKLFQSAKLEVQHPIHYGTWSNRKGEIHGQDIIIALKRGAETIS